MISESIDQTLRWESEQEKSMKEKAKMKKKRLQQDLGNQMAERLNRELSLKKETLLSDQMELEMARLQILRDHSREKERKVGWRVFRYFYSFICWIFEAQLRYREWYQQYLTDVKNTKREQQRQINEFEEHCPNTGYLLKPTNPKHPYGRNVRWAELSTKAEPESLSRK